VNAVVALELASSLNTFPGRGDLDKDAFLLDSNGFVERNEVSGLGLCGLLIKGETSVDFGRNTARNDRKNFPPEFYELSFVISLGWNFKHENARDGR
jgi:hypothetical protein